MKAAAYIIAGGEGKRLGQPKWTVELGGKRMIAFIAEALSEVAEDGEVTVVARRPIEIDGFRVIADSPPTGAAETAGGPLVGLYTALLDSESEWLIAAACDLPFLTAELLTKLLSECGDGIDAVIPIQADATPQPLCAVYRVGTCMNAAEEAILHGRLSMFGLLDRVRTRFVPFAELAPLPGSEHFFFNVNTPEDLEMAAEVIRSRR